MNGREAYGDGDDKCGARCGCCSLAFAMCRIAIYRCCRVLGREGGPVRRPELSVLCIGLLASGKSTILAQLTGEPWENIPSTLGFAFKMVQTKKAVLEVQELGGSEKIRPYWDRYFSGHNGIIFVVDSTVDNVELMETQNKLEKCLCSQDLIGLPLLVICNKQDCDKAWSVDELREKLQLDRIIDERQCFIVGCSATKDPKSLRDGLELLAEAMLEQHNLNNA